SARKKGASDRALLTPMVTCWSGAVAPATVGAAPLAGVGAALVAAAATGWPAAGPPGGAAGDGAGAQPRTVTTSRLAARRVGLDPRPRGEERTVAGVHATRRRQPRAARSDSHPPSAPRRGTGPPGRDTSSRSRPGCPAC